ncbi:hypothetical protein ACTXNW_14515 [Enterococcus malodoratus]|uniref:hypothetical protein n=1 Tax=Enterococcus malodoratus TaxID=71451 RepID=UPI003FD57F68
MAYEKQTWIPYDDNKTEEQNIQDGAVVTAERMNHLETGLDEHDKNTTNPHKVTKAQVGLGNVTNVEQAPKTDLTSHTSNKTNPHGVTKSQVGLGNVTNVEQASKTEFNSHVADKNNPHSVTKAQVNLGNIDNYATADQTDAEQGLAGNKFMTPQRVKQHFDFNLPDSIKSLLNLQSGTLTITSGNTGTLNWVRIGDLVFCMVNSLNGRGGGGLESSIGSMPFKAKRYLEFLLTSDDRSALNSAQLSVSTDGAIRWKRSSGFGSNYHGMFFYEAQE